MPRKFDPKKKDGLVSRERQESLDVQRVMSLLPIYPYEAVADVGCGPGYFSIPLGKYVFSGKVYAIDAQQEMLDATKVEMDRVHLTNIELVLSKEDRIPLEDDTVDGVFAAFVVHEADDAKIFLEETGRCLRKGGWLAVLEWHKREMDQGPPVKERIDEMEFRETAANAGFRLANRYILNENQYLLLMRR